MSNDEKQCKVCLKILNILDFYGTDNTCKSCRKLKVKEWALKNKEKVLKIKANYRNKNRQTLRDKNKIYYVDNHEEKLEYHRLYRKNHHDKRLVAQRKYYKNNKELCNRKSRNNFKKLLKISVHHKLQKRLRDRLRAALKQNIKSKPTLDMLGCKTEYFKTYLEKQFKSNMSWENYTKTGWNVDHIIPCTHFDLSIPEDQLKCFHYTNMQPLWWYDNNEKRAKLPSDYINGQRIWDDETGWIVGVYAA